MIKYFIDRLLGKAPKESADAAAAETAAAATAETAAAEVVEPARRRATPKPERQPQRAASLVAEDAAPPPHHRTDVPKSEHAIDPKQVDERAVKVVQTLVDAGHEAYIVGGAVRDLVVGLKPKDFDVATDATPEQVKALFRRAFIIGRRFRIVHVVFGRGRQDRGLSEVIEVSTFRAMVDAGAAEPVAGNERSRSALAGLSHAVDAEGRVLRDNVWGTQVDDAARRDFTVNAMYYDPLREIVVDYHGGMADARRKLLRMIGDPAARYREDPVRIIRVVRFAAKLGFEIEPQTRAPIREMAGLLDNVPPSRTFDEMIKLLQTGHALASIEELKKQGLHRGVFPVLDVALDEAHRQDLAERGLENFVELALADTDRRVGEGKPVAPSFMLACLLWHEVQTGWERARAVGEPSFPALQQAIDTVFDARIGDISGRGKLAADMREIWQMQPRFERRQGAGVATLIAQPRFRAGLDFLRLRGDAGEIDAELANWWEDYSLADDAGRRSLLDAARPMVPGPRRVRGAGRMGPPAEGSEAQAAASRHAERAAGAGSTSGPAPASAEPAVGRGRRSRTAAATADHSDLDAEAGAPEAEARVAGAEPKAAAGLRTTDGGIAGADATPGPDAAGDGPRTFETTDVGDPRAFESATETGDVPDGDAPRRRRRRRRRPAAADAGSEPGDASGAAPLDPTGGNPGRDV